MSDTARPLSGLRVVDAATLAAGPLVAIALGEFGADVIKVEQPGCGDPLRTWGNSTPTASMHCTPRAPSDA